MKDKVTMEVLACSTEEHDECKKKLRDDIQNVLWAHGTKHGADGGLDKDGDPVALVTSNSAAEIVATLAMLMGAWGEDLRQMGVPESEVRELIAQNHKIGREASADLNEVEKLDRSKLN